MKNIILVVSLFLASLVPGARAAISVGPNGSGTIRFEVQPNASEWSTTTNAGGSPDFASAAALDAGIQTNVASAIAGPLPVGATFNPATTAFNAARWNGNLEELQTVPTATAYISLLATLRNDSGTEQSALTLSYQLFDDFVSGTTPTEEIPGHRVFFSLTGETNSWQLVPELSTNRESALCATLNLGTWHNGDLLYILWADDNATAGRVATAGATGPTENGFRIDNIEFKPGAAAKAISVGPTGSPALTFDEFPNVLEGWRTGFHPGTPEAITDSAGLDAAVQANAVADFRYVMFDDDVGSPSIRAAQLAIWNLTDHFIQTVPNGVGFSSVLATLRNDTGADQTAVSIVYELGAHNAPGTTIVEEIPGHRVYFSLSGEPNTWQVIPELSSVGTPGTLAAALNLGVWPAGSPLYIVWADDNATANRSNSGDEEGGYTIDNLTFFPGVLSGVTITSPSNGRSIPQGVPISINVVALLPGTVLSVDYYVDGNLIENDPTAPFSVVYNDAPLGPHELTAAAEDDQGNVVTTTMAVNITVVPNNPPVVTITAPSAGANFLVGANVTNRVTATDADGALINVEFYLDGTLVLADVVAPYVVELCDITAGPHTLSVVATDNGNYRSTNTVSIGVTNPPNITVLVPNGSNWRYWDSGTDEGVLWVLPFYNDSGWGEGPAELGYGDLGNSRPERTTIGFGADPAAKHPTTYFRKTFSLEDPSGYTNLVLNLLRDDSAIVYINAMEVFRSNITNEVVTFATLTGINAPDDGTTYFSTNISPSILLPGDNIIAVEVHQDVGGSSDISFDLMLWAQPGGPALAITPLNATQADVSWPFPSTGYILEGRASVDSGAWSLVTAIDNPSGGFHHVTVNSASGIRFFRLRKP